MASEKRLRSVNKFLLPLHFEFEGDIPFFNPLNSELNPICHLLVLLGGATIVVVSRLRVNCIKVKRLTWAGHLVRMKDDRTLKKIFNTKPDGARSVGRPKLRWEDGGDQDMRILGVKNWKKVALNRDEWAKLLKKARAHQGLSSQ
jgi:hypothetical protein